MGDWFHVHHCIVCADHQTALRVYERIEHEGNRIEAEEDEEAKDVSGPTGVLWGFWNPTVILLSTTRKWGSFPEFIQPLIEGLRVDALTASDDDEDAKHTHAAFDAAVRARLGACRDFLWSDKPDVMRALLAELTVLDTGLTKLAVVPEGQEWARLPPAAVAALAPYPYSAITYGFITDGGACFNLGAFASGASEPQPSPLWTPLAAVRSRGPGAWALRSTMDGNERLLMHGVDKANLWRIERHGAHGAWLPREHRLLRVRALLESSVAEDRQAGSALARRWWLPESTSTVELLRNDRDEHVRASAQFAYRTLMEPSASSQAGRIADPWFGVSTLEEAHDLAQALSLIDHADVGGAARWAVASLADVDPIAEQVVQACSSLAEISTTFLAAWLDDDRGRAFLSRVGELAYAATRTSYWMIRYGAPNADAPASVGAIDLRPPWSGESKPSAARIFFWAARTVEARSDSFSRRTLLQGYVAFDELLTALRTNRAWLMPPLGAIQADLVALLKNEGIAIDVGVPPPGNEELVGLRASAAEISAQLQTVTLDASATAPLLHSCSQALRSNAVLPLFVDPYAQYGINAPPLLSWIANHLAWQFFVAEKPELALPYAELGVKYDRWDDDAARDTLARVLIALGRESEAHALVRHALRRNPSSDAFGEIAAAARRL